MHIWGMSETTSGVYCQQWTAIRGATCICDAVTDASASVADCGILSPVYLGGSKNKMFDLGCPLRRAVAEWC